MAIIIDAKKIDKAKTINELYTRCLGQFNNLKQMLSELEVIKDEILNDTEMFSSEDKIETDQLYNKLINSIKI